MQFVTMQNSPYFSYFPSCLLAVSSQVHAICFSLHMRDTFGVYLIRYVKLQAYLSLSFSFKRKGVRYVEQAK
jgi:hypothetical protein